MIQVVAKKMCLRFHVRLCYYYNFEKYVKTIVSKAWREVILYKSKNIASGFGAAGLWPLYFPFMQHRLKLFKEFGITY